MDCEKEGRSAARRPGTAARALEREGLRLALRAGAHAYIARTPCKVALVQPEDVFELVEQANLPGTVDAASELAAQAAAAPRSAGRAIARVSGRRRGDGRAQPAWRIAAWRRNACPTRLIACSSTRFRFADAIKLVPYLARLGVSHLYASPFLKARPGSTHGYDIVDHNAVNPRSAPKRSSID